VAPGEQRLVFAAIATFGTAQEAPRELRIETLLRPMPRPRRCFASWR